MSIPRGGLACSVPVMLSVAGCATAPSDRGFDRVRQDVSERAGLRVHWSNGSQADAEAAAAVAAMLSQELTADRAVQIALLNNRDLQGVYEELSLAQADVVQAGLLRNPVFSAEARFDTGGGGTAYTLELAQDFVSLLYLPLRKGRARAAFEAAQVRVTGAVLDTAFTVREAFVEYQAAEQTIEMRATVVEATRASYDLARRLREAGNNLELDVVNERALYEQSKVDLASAEQIVLQARERLNALMGLWGEQTSWTSARRLPALPEDEPAADDLQGRAVQASLDLALLRREAEVAARSAGMARPFGWLDDAEVGVAAEREIEADWTVGPAVSVPIPLFDQGQASLARAQGRARQVSAQYFARAVALRASVRAAYSAVLAAQDRARYYQYILLPLRERIVEETQLQYNAMQVGAFQLLQAKRDQIQAGADYVGSIRDYWIARARLDHVLSGRMPPFDGGAVVSTTQSTASGSARKGDH